MQLISQYSKGIRYLLCVIDLFSRYAWVIPLKNKKGESIVEVFGKILDDSGNAKYYNRKPNEIWVDHGSEFYNNKFKSFLKENDIEMYSTFNQGKSVVAGRFIKTYNIYIIYIIIYNIYIIIINIYIYNIYNNI